MTRTAHQLAFALLALALTQGCGRKGRRVAVDPNAASATDIVASLSGVLPADLARDWFTYALTCDAAATPVTGKRGPEKDMIVVTFAGASIKDGTSCSVAIQGTAPAADAPQMAAQEGAFYKSAPAAVTQRKLALTMTKTYGPATPVEEPEKPVTETPPAEKPPTEKPPTDPPATTDPPAEGAKEIGVSVQSGGDCRYWNPETWQCE